MVFRVKKTKNYTVMSNYHLRDRRLSLKAKGLLSQMLSLPDDWNYTAKGLAAINKEHFNTIREIIRELEKAGYIVRRQKREQSGEWNRMEYDIYEIPQSAAEEDAETPDAAPPVETEEEAPDITAALMGADALKIDAAKLDEWRGEIRNNIAFPWDDEAYANFDALREYVELMAQVCAGEESIKANGREIPAEETRKRFLSLGPEHILYVMECVGNVRHKVRNIRAYTLAALYNAPDTIEQYRKAKNSAEYWRIARKYGAEDEDEDED